MDKVYVTFSGERGDVFAMYLRCNYVLRYVPSQADVAVFEAITTPPSANLCHALRWFNHIKSYQNQKNR